MKRVDVNGAELVYVEQGIGEPVVFVHGALSDYRLWAAQMEALAPHYRAIAYSRRDHCPNTWSGDGSDYSLAHHAADLAAFLRALKLGPAHLVGHSYGGALAALVALAHPELVRSLVLGEPTFFSALQGAKERSLVAELQQRFGEVRRLSQNGQGEQAVREFLKAAVGADVFDSLPEAARSMIMDNARTLDPMLWTFPDPTPFDCDRARRISAPTLLVRGEFSPEINHLIADLLAGCFPNAEMFILPGASHGLQIEKPAEFNEAVREFIGKHRGKEKLAGG